MNQTTTTTTAQVLEVVGPQEYSLVNKGPIPGINPLEAWSAPSHKRIFNADELYEIFSKECIAFIGDSTDRRAADTLSILLKNRRKVSGITWYLNKYSYGHTDKSRNSTSVDGFMQLKECVPDTVDNLWRPTYNKVVQYNYRNQKDYSVIVASSGPWNHKGKPKFYTPVEIRERIQQVINHLDKSIPDDVLLMWKTAGWTWRGDWHELKDNETNNNPNGNNWMVHYGNQIAKETILGLNSTSRILLDWATEIAPYSWEHRIPTNMAAEYGDRVTWHYGPKARVLLAQMVAWEVARYRNSTLLSVPGTAIGRGIQSGTNSSQNSNDTLHGSATQETMSGSSGTIQNDDNAPQMEANSTIIQVADPPIEKNANYSGTFNRTTSTMNVSEPLVDSIPNLRSVQNDDNKQKIEENSTTSQVADPPIENGTFPGKYFTANASEPLVDSNKLRNYTQNPKMVSDTPTISSLINHPNSSFRGETMRFGAIFIVLYAIKMKMKSRSKSRSEYLEAQTPTTNATK